MKQWATQGKFAQNVLKVMTGTVLMQMISILAQPLLTRLYTPVDYGMVASIQAVAGVFSVMGALCYDRAIVIAKTDNEAWQLGVLSLKLYTIIALITSVLLSFHFVWQLVFGFQQHWWLLILIALWLIASGVSIVFVNLSTRLQHYGRLAKRQVKAGSLGITIQLAAGLLHSGFVGLIVANVASTIFAVQLLAKNLSHGLAKELKAKLYPLAKKFHEFPKYQLPGVLLDTLSLQLMVILINKLLGSSIAGQYALANKVLAIPLNVVGVAFAQVFYQEFAKRFAQQENVLSFLLKVWRKLFLIGLVPCLILFFFGEPLFVLVFGKQWHLAGWFASYLTLSSFLMLISSPTSSAFIVIGLQKYQLYFAAFAAIIRCLAIYIMCYNLLYGVITFVLVELIGIIAYNLLIIMHIKRVV